MAITVDWGTKIINVPKSFLTYVSPNLYSLDLNEFRLALKDIEDNEDGMANPDTNRHNTTVLLDGVTYARTIEIINGYTITFEAGAYAVKLEGANSNVSSVTNINGVSLRTTNSAGLIEVTTGDCDLTEVNTKLDDIKTVVDTIEVDTSRLLDIEEGNWKIQNNQMIFYARDGSTLLTFNLRDTNGNPTESDVVERVRV